MRLTPSSSCFWMCQPARHNAGFMLGQRLWRWPSMKPALGQRLLFAGIGQQIHHRLSFPVDNVRESAVRLGEGTGVIWWIIPPVCHAIETLVAYIRLDYVSTSVLEYVLYQYIQAICRISLIQPPACHTWAAYPNRAVSNPVSGWQCHLTILRRFS